MAELVKSVSDNDAEILKGILDLHSIDGTVDVDPTYSKGNFYKRTGIPEPKFKSDLYPADDSIVKASADDLPLPDNSVNTIVFDPPFLATTGKSLQKDDGSNLMAKRFSVFSSEQELHNFYINSLAEFFRILKDDGIVIFKCQDKVSSGKQYFSHVFIMNGAEKLGFYTKDLFVLTKKNRLVADWQKKNQKHARKFHSYFLVFEKSKKRVNYL